MQTIDFSELKLKYPILNEADINFLNEFFSRKEILDKFIEIEAERKKKFKTFIIVESVFLLISILYLNNNNASWDGPIFGYALVFAFLSFFIFMFVSVFFKDWGHEIKNEILPKFASEINSDLKYDLGKKYYFWNELEMVSGWLLERYDRVDLIEDSIIYTPKGATVQPATPLQTSPSASIAYGDQPPAGTQSLPDATDTEDLAEETPTEVPQKAKENSPYTIEWYEFKSSRRHTDKNGRSNYVVNNHCYLLKVTFNNARQKLTDWMALLRDVNDNFIRKVLRVLAIDASIVGWYLYITQPDKWDNLWVAIILGLSDLLNVPIWIFTITILIVLVIITYQIQWLILNRNRIKTENSDFEKEFDVYCKDQVVSRTILTPSFMYKIYDFTGKIDNRRIYEFFFVWNSIYVKLNLMGPMRIPYMEVSASSDLRWNIQKFVEFYIEIKNVTELAKDLWFEYFDKDTYNNQVIK
ncbi:MAG: hypothetical protein ACD_2C00172G0006 [uncultured bacterium (gcode 4)]|uniref:Uncharacterized protein n=1 Tax=uncultured bacterium (gcode 4) TaxID=1234023 RepID=K2G2M9_9BACT|nr:MAG: hypothetical protein ACD_2C00172G0006 [uncultured bacterium (gcode 4)]